MLNNIEQKLVPKSSLYEGKVDSGSKLLNEFLISEKNVFTDVSILGKSAFSTARPSPCKMGPHQC